MAGYIDGIKFEHYSRRTRHPFSAKGGMFPYRPFDLTKDDIDDFSYDFVAFRDGPASHEIAFERNVSFSDAGLLEHVTFSFGVSTPSTVDVDVLRCGGVVLESTDFSDDGPPNLAYELDETIVYYYGCDDFVLPTLPNL